MLKVYSKQNCPACVNAKNLLNKYEVPFEEINIDKDAEAKAFIIAQGFRQVPQIFFKSNLFVEGGFLGLMKMTEQEIKEILYGKEAA